MHTNTLRALALVALLTSPLSAVEEATSPAPVEVGVVVTSTTFYARNISAYDQVLLFRSGGVLAWRTLPPGCDLKWEYPTQALAGIDFEVAKWADGRWHRTGTLKLEDLSTRGADALWVQGDLASTTWTEVGSTLLVENTGESIFPDTLPAPTSEGNEDETLIMSPMHVPVITPSETPAGDVPPVIEDTPLPPA
jgi:hypothetical protein